MTYQYCVDIPNLSADDVANGLDCSPVAKAAFVVNGPTATITADTTHWTVSPTISDCNSTRGLQFISFGRLDAKKSTLCKQIVAVSGITFSATVNLSPGNSGQTEWVQVIRTNTVSGTSVSGQPFTTNIGTGLDNILPYNFGEPDSLDAPITATNDSPDSSLDVDFASFTKAFDARMYLMWTSQIPDSIPVPLGYVEWAVSGTANANDLNTPPWSLTSFVPTQKSSHVSEDNGTKTHGLPTWSHLVKNTNSATSAADQAYENEDVEEQ